MIKLALEHSKDMAEGRVPFGHQGFDNRVARFPIIRSSAGENVAYIAGVAAHQTPAVKFLF